MSPVSLVSLNGSHSASSSTHAVATLAAELYGSGEIVDLVTLDPAGLIGTSPSPDVAGLLAAIAEASILVLVTPIYRATYSGLLKVVFDQLPAGGLKGKAAVLAATAGGPAHYLALDTGMRSLVASLDGWTVPTVTYATPADFDEVKHPSDNVRASLEAGLAEAARLVS
jgi:FMN reductase